MARVQVQMWKSKKFRANLPGSIQVFEEIKLTPNRPIQGWTRSKTRTQPLNTNSGWIKRYQLKLKVVAAEDLDLKTKSKACKVTWSRAILERKKVKLSNSSICSNLITRTLRIGFLLTRLEPTELWHVKKSLRELTKCKFNKLLMLAVICKFQLCLKLKIPWKIA